MKLLFFITAIAVSSSKPCTNCDRNNATCVDGVCLPRCVSGECLQCRDPRFYGKQCEQDCPDTCLNSRCQLDNTRVVCTEGCVTGKKGDNCGVNCDAACTQCERYGNDCMGRCQDPRYYGPLCRTTCPSSCRGGCDKDTGECDKCDSGYNGRKTTQSGEEATDGRDEADHKVSKSDGSGHWAHKYWEIHDKATDTDSYATRD
ncbi:cell death abnormality protein 1-like [Haliotis cracherodii]|uniref:cell death abnormality protein 1-like n=1 Tax=Haliotis cracherodii TaxID=6455 RepID=UPI0039E7B460